MARRILIVFGIVVGLAGIIRGEGDLFIVGTLAAVGAFVGLKGNGGRKF